MTTIQWLYNTFAYPVKILKDGIPGMMATFARNACYKVFEKDTSNMGWVEYFQYHAETKAVCEKFGSKVFDNDNLSTFAVLGAGAAAGFTCASYCNSKYRNYQYDQYLAKTDAEYDELSDNIRSSFEVGLRSSGGTVTRCWNMFRYNTWLHPNAYYAGFEAGKQKNHEMIRKVCG